MRSRQFAKLSTLGKMTEGEREGVTFVKPFEIDFCLRVWIIGGKNAGVTRVIPNPKAQGEVIVLGHHIPNFMLVELHQREVGCPDKVASHKAIHLDMTFPSVYSAPAILPLIQLPSDLPHHREIDGG